MARSELEYLDNRPLFYPSLKSYPKGLEVRKGDIIKVNDDEKKYFLRQRNGKLKCFIEKRQPRKTDIIEEQGE